MWPDCQLIAGDYLCLRRRKFCRNGTLSGKEVTNGNATFAGKTINLCHATKDHWLYRKTIIRCVYLPCRPFQHIGREVAPVFYLFFFSGRWFSHHLLPPCRHCPGYPALRSEEHTYELQSLMRI